VPDTVRGANGAHAGFRVSVAGAAAAAASGPGAEPAAAAAAALEAVLRLRAPAIHASTPMVARLSRRLAERLGRGPEDQALVVLCARVRDIGMVALPDSLLAATGPLSPEEWELVNRHPAIGAALLDDLPGLAPAAEVVRAHHERWDGEGYPDGRRGNAIPLLSRVIATADAFVALASDRPHRRSVGAEAALEYIVQDRGSQFDPEIVDALVAVVSGRQARRGVAGARRLAPETPGPRDIRSALADVDVLPAFAPAYERALELAARPGAGGELVAAIESDAGLTVAVLRLAQANRANRRRGVTSVADAVPSVDRDQLRATIQALPCAAFPWQTRLEELLHRDRVHGLAVVRAAHRIAGDASFGQRDELIVAALLHDVGRLVLARARPVEAGGWDAARTTPEERLRLERRTLKLDHASVGALRIERWGLARPLARAVAEHHVAEAPGELATFVRLADMVTHHALGDPVDRRVLLRLASACGLTVAALRDVLFDLPHAGGSQRRRAEPSPLSERETAILRQLGAGKVYKEIGAELGLSTSTVRSHLHNIYAKLEVSDRAQAVLRASEMAWI
jgi:HD-GYP domain-containing protein (c-di-GMP phosphodiesterase class II)/DNA-binding CsgD family transcriptional regulator